MEPAQRSSSPSNPFQAVENSGLEQQSAHHLTNEESEVVVTEGLFSPNELNQPIGSSPSDQTLEPTVVEQSTISLEQGFWASPESQPSPSQESGSNSMFSAAPSAAAGLYSNVVKTEPVLAPSSGGFSNTEDNNPDSAFGVLFSYQGRIPRSTYWIYALITTLCFGIFSATPLARDTFLLIVVFAVFVWSNFSLIVKRYHDLGKSGWWSLLSFIPIVNIWVTIETGFFPGNKDTANRFGPPR